MSIQTASVVLIPVLVPARGESHTAENLSVTLVFERVQVCPRDALILKDIPLFLCKTVQTWLRQANVMP